MIPNDLYFTYIKIQPTVQNALVCKHWHNTLKYNLREKKIRHYDTRLYETILGKVYTNTKIYQTLNIIEFSKKYYDTLIDTIMQKIIRDKTISDIIRKNMIEYYNIFIIFYTKYDDYDINIAKEYRQLLFQYYDLDLTKLSIST